MDYPFFDPLFAGWVPRTSLAYFAYRAGDYKPNEYRPPFTIRGKRIWWKPWRREPAEVVYGMSEAMAFRLQDLVSGRSPTSPVH